MPSKHKADMHMLNPSTANHFHCPGKQESVLVRACGVVQDDSKPMDP